MAPSKISDTVPCKIHPGARTEVKMIALLDEWDMPITVQVEVRCERQNHLVYAG